MGKNNLAVKTTGRCWNIVRNNYCGSIYNNDIVYGFYFAMDFVYYSFKWYNSVFHEVTKKQRIKMADENNELNELFFMTMDIF